jgi:hypothetical protein
MSLLPIQMALGASTMFVNIEMEREGTPSKIHQFTFITCTLTAPMKLRRLDLKLSRHTQFKAEFAWNLIIFVM